MIPEALLPLVIAISGHTAEPEGSTSLNPSVIHFIGEWLFLSYIAELSLGMRLSSTSNFPAFTSLFGAELQQLVPQRSYGTRVKLTVTIGLLRIF